VPEDSTGAAAACGLYRAGGNRDRPPVRFLGDSLKCLRDFPEGARHDAGYQLSKVQRSGRPDDFDDNSRGMCRSMAGAASALVSWRTR